MTQAPSSPPAMDPGADEPLDDSLLDELSPVQLQALRWSVRMGDAPPQDVRAEFLAWLQADAAHREAYEDMDGVMAAVDAIPPQGTARLRTTLAIDNAQQSSARSAAAQAQPVAVPATPPAPLAAPPSAPPSAPGRRRLVQSLLASLAVAVLGGGWLGWERWQDSAVFQQTFATQRGQSRQVDLPDGSRLRMDTASEAQVALYRQRREVRLPEGQVFFEVQGDKARPFEVLAGAARITVVGTRFAVRHTPSLGGTAVQVSVVEGRVRVSPGRAQQAAAAPAFVELRPGQSIAVDAQGRLGAVAAQAPQAMASWLEQRLSFENTPLELVLAELGRYGDFGVRIADPAVGALPITASVDLRQVDSFVRSLPLVLAVRLRVRDGATEIVGAGH